MVVIEEVTFHCRTQMKIKKLNYEWNICNFWHTLDCVTDLYADEVTEYFRLHMLKLKDELQIYVTKKDEKLINTFCSAFLITATGEKLIVSKSYTLCHYRDPEPLFSIKISQLKSEEDTYIVNDTLKMRFNFSVCHNIVNQSICYVHEPGELINTNVKELISTHPHKLVTFLIDGKNCDINKILLCSQSKFFKDIFSKESTSDEIELTDVAYDTFQNLIFFIQIGQLDKQIETDVTALCDLLEAADKYDIKNLKLMCEQRIINNVSMQNILYIFEVAHSCNGKILKNYAKNFIKLYFEDIVNTREFLDLLKKFPDLLIEIQNVQIFEGHIDV